MYSDMKAGYRQTLHYYNTQIMVIELTVYKACYVGGLKISLPRPYIATL